MRPPLNLRPLCDLARRVAGIGLLALLPLALQAGADAGVTRTPAPGSPDFDALLARAERELAAGDRAAVVKLLAPRQAAIDAEQDPWHQRMLDALLGRAYLQTGQPEEAEPFLRAAASLAQASGDLEGVAGAQNDLGIYLTIRRDDDDAAFAAFAKAQAAADGAALPLLSARVEVNTADLFLRRGEMRLAQHAVARAAAALHTAPASVPRERLRSALAARAIEAGERAPAEADWPVALALTRAAAEEAQQFGDARGVSSAWGETSQIEALTHDLQQALMDGQRAIFAAQAAQAPDLLYRWQWDAGRIHRILEQPEDALEDYRQAIATLKPIRQDVMLDLRAQARSYRDAVGPLYLGYSDLLLRSTSDADTSHRTQNLRRAREAIEQLKTVELEDYFQDDCSPRLEGHEGAVDQVPEHTAVIYPVVLPDRLELLVSTRQGIEQFTVAVPGKTLSDEALRLRKWVVRPDSNQYLQSAQRLYGWLIQPLSADLESQRVDTLVVVPDGALMGIPFAALHDGNAFLVQKYSIATVPGLRWVDLQHARSHGQEALVGGLSEAVQGFPALPGVESELRDVAGYYGAETLDNAGFTETNLERALRNQRHSVVHIASHAQFASEASKSFLLTYDGRIGLNALEHAIGTDSDEDAVDLLTLSACETAAGDERSALGLAGVAIKAGARSVMATLWNVDDQAASVLVREFYRQLRAGKQSKAQALRAAELSLLSDPRFAHPVYWAPFLVIGNWL